MTTVEIRLTTPARLAEALASPVDAIGLGQEGCLTKLPDTDTLRAAAAQIRAAGRTVVLVAPVAWPRTADELLARIRAVTADGPTTVAVNDASTALALADRPADCTLVAGLGLTRARPHSAHPDRAGAPPATVDTALLAVLRPAAVEVDADTDVTAAVAEGWPVRRYVDAVPVGYGRSCPTARRHHSGPPDCRPLCDTPYTIRAHQRWQLNHGHREPLPAGVTPPVLTVWGNAVYQPATGPTTADYHIIDARWHTPEALAAAVRRARDQVPVPTGR
ncbi:hypothetical protein [Micromonospora cathayae]|uniref:Uncharacterized protein n=1 Tax=Micromonospora cathayae TaxID=3028804 RepID=A0ABY7ZIR0_9ACTN|nr:hypothetical protein [Micromonospora sp. HUAS 3]WDZ82840.1 hypothetical protein PVK37_20465 [Micromonospora sp. HUAS 3]